MTKKKVLYVDNDHTQVNNMIALFQEKELYNIYEFESIHCPVDSKNWDMQKNFVISEISKKKAGIDILLLDLFLVGDPKNDEAQGIPLSLAVADTLKAENFKIVFITGYTNKNGLLTGNPKWDSKRYLDRNKPKLNLPLAKITEGYCPAMQDGKCPKENIGQCTYKDCFIQYMKLLHSGEITHD